MMTMDQLKMEISDRFMEWDNFFTQQVNILHMSIMSHYIEIGKVTNAWCDIIGHVMVRFTGPSTVKGADYNT